MFKEFFQSISGIEIFGVVIMIFFFVIFLVVIYWSIKVDKQYLNKMSNMPLDSSTTNGDLNHD